MHSNLRGKAQVEIREVGGLKFWLVGVAELQRTADGLLYEYSHAISTEQRLNAYAAGPFCRVALAAAPRAPGVYALVVDGALKYIGRCENMAARFGPRGYGHISPRNVHADGQSTNCKINAKILAATKAGAVVQAWFHPTPDFVRVEAALIELLMPEWNGRNGAGTVIRSKRTTPPNASTRKIRVPAPSAITPRRHDFERELQSLLDRASLQGLHQIEITAGQLHRIVGSYPGDHRMPVCCACMRAAMIGQDRIVYAPLKGNGASLTIEYHLPR